MTPIFRIAPLLLVTAASSLAASFQVLLDNADFQSGPTGLHQPIEGWKEFESGTGIDDNYVHDPAGQINSHVLALKADGGNWVGQDITQSESGAIDATSFGAYTVILDYGYRADVADNWGHGDITLRVSLWNTTTDTELSSYDLLVTDPAGQQEPQWQKTGFQIPLSYDNTAQAPGDVLQIRFVQVTPDMNEDNWQATAMLDNIEIYTGPPADPWLKTGSSFSFENHGASASFQIPFSNIGVTENLVISSVTPGGADAGFFTDFTFPSDVAPGNPGAIEFTFHPTDGVRTYTAVLTIASNDSQTPSREVAVTVNVVDPAISPDAGQIDFGTLPANPGPQSRTLAVTNNGATRNLDIASATLQRGTNGFSVASAPATINPGDSGNIVITFDPGDDGGAFADVLVIESNDPKTPTLRVPVLANVTIPEGGGTLLVLTNPGFEAGPWNSHDGTSPQGWISDPPFSATAFGNYGQSAPRTPNIVGIAAHMQGQPFANYYQQSLSDNNTGLTASQINAVTISFDRAYRNDTATQGDIFLHVSLQDTTNGAEIAGRDVLIPDTGVVPANLANQLSRVVLKLAYDNSAYSTEQLAIRVTHVAPAANPTWAATALLDNFAVSADYVTIQPDNFASWADGYGIPADEADDSDLDNIPALVEYALDLDPTHSDPSPAVLAADHSLSFSKNPDAVANGDISYAIETSPDMTPGSWTAATPDTDDATTISYTLPAGQTKIFARLVVTRS